MRKLNFRDATALRRGGSRWQLLKESGRVLHHELLSFSVDQDQRLILLEMEEKIDLIFSVLDSLRSVGTSGKTRRELLEEIFRNVHSLKASAASQHLEELATLAHEFENLLHSLRSGRIEFDDEIQGVFDETADSFFEALSEARDTQTTLLDRLRQLSNAPVRRQRAEAEILLKALPSEVWQSLHDQERHRLQESIAEGAHLYLVSTNFETANFDRQFHDLKDILAARGELISTAPTVDSDHPDRVNFRILYSQQASIEEIELALSGLSNVSVSEVLGFAPASVSKQSVSPATMSPPDDLFSDRADFVRVSVNELDRLISSAYVLLREVDDLGQSVGCHSELESVARNLRESYLRLASGIVQLRMISVTRVLQRAERAGRTAARSCAKDVEFEIHGSELLLDKSLCDAITDPLIHLVRNAVDHGIEEPIQRVKSGKSARGNVTIKATMSQSQPRITVTDDGRGIDPDLIREAAIRLGIEREPVSLTLERSLRMIFRPGFSTTSAISNVSGRGVGLDVVETSIEQLGGEIRVSSEPGVGSSFEIRLPVTFGLLETVIVRCGKYLYALDASKVVPAGDFRPRENEEFPLLELDSLLSQSVENKDRPRILLVFEFPGEADDGTTNLERFGLLVDGVEKRERVLVRNLGSHSGRWFGVAGAAELPDGTVALLLDLPRLLMK